MSVFGAYRGGGPIGVLAGSVLLSAVSYLLPYAAPFTAVALWYRAATWVRSGNGQRALAGWMLLGLAVAMTAYAALVVTGLPVDVGFEEVTGR
ncbi:hypothetical protein [Halorubellus sp. PRR65]|uniref:hypothetical protein n=1 Tax=Halorubellus sp. PRR65 TaxID=3098148 RepID=UPI002B2603F1|nr:hypothetical protein [Halorubellus sp. PRR65]